MPLTSCRLLLSPSPPEIASEPALADLADAATVENLNDAAYAWRADAASDRDNVTLFYFAGHGVQRLHGEHVLLLQDFGKPNTCLLRSAFDSTNLIQGMAVTEPLYRIARDAVVLLRCVPGYIGGLARL